jgi:hypothetical protein
VWRVELAADIKERPSKFDRASMDVRENRVRVARSDVFTCEVKGAAEQPVLRFS